VLLNVRLADTMRTRQVLIELGPSYFRYMDSTATKPTVLAKLLGFYTIEIRNLENGTTQAKADLLVMENLFYDKKITKAFDLKGIQGRKVKANANPSGSKTLFDGEWIEGKFDPYLVSFDRYHVVRVGQQRALTLLHPHSKLVLQEAIKSDAEYLSRGNIMDYSQVQVQPIPKKYFDYFS
jgi:1-phosphatidylinositol-3-phosphate 5-kinase